MKLRQAKKIARRYVYTGNFQQWKKPTLKIALYIWYCRRFDKDEKSTTTW